MSESTNTRAWLVHGSDGTDEIAITGPTYVAELKEGEVTEYEITPADAPSGTGGDSLVKGQNLTKRQGSRHARRR